MRALTVTVHLWVTVTCYLYIYLSAIYLCLLTVLLQTQIYSGSTLVASRAHCPPPLRQMDSTNITTNGFHEPIPRTSLSSSITTNGRNGYICVWRRTVSIYSGQINGRNGGGQ